MSTRWQRWRRWAPVRLVADDRAQALTEYAVVIPVVLLMFFSVMQTMVVAQASQLANYAAFAGARSYATSYGKFLGENNGDAAKADEEAKKRARNAVLLVMAPVSHAQVGEALPVWNAARGALSGMPDLVQEFYGLAEGFAVAYVYRVKNFTLTQSDDVVRVTFNYLVPMTLPGFAEMWNYLHRKRPGDGQSMAAAFPDLGAPFIDPSGLSGALGGVLDALSAVENLFGSNQLGSVGDLLNSAVDAIYATGFAGARYNLTVSAKSVCGFEPWNGTVRTDDIEDRCEGEVDEAMQACGQAMDDRREAAEAAAEAARIACLDADQKQNIHEQKKAIYQQKEAEYQACLQSSANPAVACAAKLAARNEAYQEEQNAYRAADAAKDNCEDKNEEAERAGDMSNVPECQQ